VAWVEAYLHTKFHLDPCNRLATINMGRNLGGLSSSWGGELGPMYVTQCRLGRGLPSYEVASSSIEPFGHNIYGPKIGGCAPLWEGDLGPHLTQCGHRDEAYLHDKFHLDWPTVCHNTPTLPTGQNRQTDRHRANRFTNGRPKTEMGFVHLEFRNVLLILKQCSKYPRFLPSLLP